MSSPENDKWQQNSDELRLTTQDTELAFRRCFVVVRTQVACILICIYNCINTSLTHMHLYLPQHVTTELAEHFLVLTVHCCVNLTLE